MYTFCELKFLMKVVFVIFIIDVAYSGRDRDVQLYNINKVVTYFSDEYFTNTSLTFAPIRNKWGRISINVTIAKTIEAAWLELRGYQQNDMKKFEPNRVRMDLDMCDIIQHGENNMIFKFIPALYGYVKDYLHITCPLEKGFKVTFPEQTIPGVPRAGSMKVFPAGNYKYTFRFRGLSNLTLAEVTFELIYRGF